MLICGFFLAIDSGLMCDKREREMCSQCEREEKPSCNWITLAEQREKDRW
jgi:hypothetical protein